MFAKIKKWYAFILISKKFPVAMKNEQSFKKFYSNSKNILIALPGNEALSGVCDKILSEFINDEKKITLAIPEESMESTKNKSKFSFITYSQQDLGKLMLPTKEFAARFADKSFDLFIDLELTESLLNYAFAGLSSAKFRVGFKLSDSDRFYNFQIPLEERNYEISCGNLLNSLRMF